MDIKERSMSSHPTEFQGSVKAITPRDKASMSAKVISVVDQRAVSRVAIIVTHALGSMNQGLQ